MRAHSLGSHAASRASAPHPFALLLVLGLLVLGLLSSPRAVHADASQDPTEGVLCPAHCVPLDDSTDPLSPVNLNTADERALLELPGIGPARARAILEFRQSHGAFRSLSQLLHIKGIGRALLKRLRPLVKL